MTQRNYFNLTNKNSKMNEKYEELKEEYEKVKERLKKKENVARQDKHEIRSMHHKLGILRIKDKNMIDEMNKGIAAQTKKGISGMKSKLETNSASVKTPVKQLSNLFEDNWWMKFCTFEESELGITIYPTVDFIPVLKNQF